MLSFNCSSHKGKGALALGEFIPSSHSRVESDGVKQSRLLYALLSACSVWGEEGGLHGNFLRCSSWLCVPFLDCVDL